MMMIRDLIQMCRPSGPLHHIDIQPGPDGPGRGCNSPPGLNRRLRICKQEVKTGELIVETCDFRLTGLMQPVVIPDRQVQTTRCDSGPEA